MVKLTLKLVAWVVGGVASVVLVAAGVGAAHCVLSSRAHAPTADDCVVIQIWSNDFHTDLVLPGEAFGPDHPIRTLYPNAEHFMVGYGSFDFFVAEAPGPWDVLKVAIPPTYSTLHILVADRPVPEVWRPTSLTPVALSQAGLEAIAQDIANAMVLGADGSPVVIQPGLMSTRNGRSSVFVEARPDYHLFNTCNQWTAGRVAKAGAPICPFFAMWAPWFTDGLSRRAPGECPPAS